MQAATDRKLLRFAGIEEIEERPAFRWVVPAGAVTPKEAIGVYNFPESAQQMCGLSNCRTLHSKGFLVLMDTGEETLIGGVCGAKKMGLVFQEIINRAQRADRMSRYRDTIRHSIEQADAFNERLNALLDRPFGARWLSKRMAEVRRILPSEALHKIELMARRMESDVSISQRMEAAEVAIAKETGAIPKGEKGPFFRSVKVGEISGLDIWRTDLRALLIDDMQKGMQDLRALDVDQLDSEYTLRSHAKWIGSISDKFTEAERLIAAGEAFFAADNLKLLKHLSTDQRVIRGLDGAIEQVIRQTLAAG